MIVSGAVEHDLIMGMVIVQYKWIYVTMVFALVNHSPMVRSL